MDAMDRYHERMDRLEELCERPDAPEPMVTDDYVGWCEECGEECQEILERGGFAHEFGFQSTWDGTGLSACCRAGILDEDPKTADEEEAAA